MTHVENRRLKREIATAFAKTIGFQGLSDFKTTIYKTNLLFGISFLRKNKDLIMRVFKGRSRVQLRKPIHANAVIKVFRSLLRDQAINRAVQTKKINFKSVDGSPTSVRILLQNIEINPLVFRTRMPSMYV